MLDVRPFGGCSGRRGLQSLFSLLRFQSLRSPIDGTGHLFPCPFEWALRQYTTAGWEILAQTDEAIPRTGR